jgi:hypothetical protein
MMNVLFYRRHFLDIPAFPLHPLWSALATIRPSTPRGDENLREGRKLWAKALKRFTGRPYQRRPYQRLSEGFLELFFCESKHFLGNFLEKHRALALRARGA